MGVNLFLYCSDHKGVVSLGHFTRDSADTVNLRDSDLPVVSTNWPELQQVEQVDHASEQDEDNSRYVSSDRRQRAPRGESLL